MKTIGRILQSGRARFWLPVFIYAVGLAVRLPVLLQARSDVLFNHPIMDGATYNAWGCSIAQGHVLGSGVFYQEPLYAYILGAIYAVAGQSFFLAAIVQVAVDSFNCVLLYFLGARLFSRGVGFVAASVFAFFGQAVFHALMPAKETWAVLFLLLALLATLRAVKASTSGGAALAWWFAAGLALAGLILLRGNALLLVPLLGLWLWLALPQVKRVPRVIMLGLWLAGVAVPILAVSTRNYLVGGQFVLTSAHVGFNYYIGNGPSADGTYKPVPGVREDPVYEGADARAVASAKNGNPLTMAQTSSFFWRWTLDYDIRHPGEWARVLGLKVLRFFNGREVPDTWTIDLWRERFPLLNAAFIPFWVIVGPALLGVVLAVRPTAPRSILHITLLSALAGTVVFYLLTRYRLPFVPVFILFAAAGLARLYNLITSRAWHLTIIALITLALGTGLALVPLPGASPAAYRANDMLNLAEIYKNTKQVEPARRACRDALVFDAGSARAYTVLAELEVAENRPDQAEPLLRRALEIDERDANAHYLLGCCYQLRGDNAKTFKEWRMAVDCRPGFALVFREMGLLLLKQGDTSAAGESLKKADSLQPDDAKTLLALGSFDYGTGRTDDARTCWRHVIKVAPDSVEAGTARRNLQKSFGDNATPSGGN